MNETPDPRSFVAQLLVQYGYSHSAAETLVQHALDKHAHELAETLRGATPPPRLPFFFRPYLNGWIDGRETMADLIDPEVTQ